MTAKDDGRPTAGDSLVLYRIGRVLLTGGCRLLFRVRVTGKENVPEDGVYIVAPTHRSNFDIPFAADVTTRRIRFMAKESLFTTKFGAWFFTRSALSVSNGGRPTARHVPRDAGRARGGRAAGDLPRGDPPRGAGARRTCSTARRTSR